MKSICCTSFALPVHCSIVPRISKAQRSKHMHIVIDLFDGLMHKLITPKTRSDDDDSKSRHPMVHCPQGLI